MQVPFTSHPVSVTSQTTPSLPYTQKSTTSTTGGYFYPSSYTDPSSSTFVPPPQKTGNSPHLNPSIQFTRNVVVPPQQQTLSATASVPSSILPPNTYSTGHYTGQPETDVVQGVYTAQPRNVAQATNYPPSTGYNALLSSANPNDVLTSSYNGPYGSYASTAQQPSNSFTTANANGFFQQHSAEQQRHTARQGGSFSSKTGPQPLNEATLADFSASPEFVRCTTRRMPISAALKQKLHIPLGFTFRPLAPSERNIPEVNFGSTGKVIRCHRCRTYVNPFAVWEPNCRRWICNICAFVNECPQHYISHLDETGCRVDRYERKELSSGSIEIIAPADYMVRPPQPPVFLFLIDVSLASVSSGLLATVCQGIKSAMNLKKIPGGPRTQIGVITFDSSIHFYKLDAASSQPHMVVVSSLDDVFIPLPDGILVNFSESEARVKTLLDVLPSMWSKQRIAETCTGSALKAALAAAKQWGGKISLFMATPPTLGEYPLLGHRDSMKGNGENELETLQPTKSDYKDLATLMTQAQLSVDLYVCPCAAPSGRSQNSMDLPTIGPLVKYTAGELHYYPVFNAMTCGDKLREEICHSLTREMGWEAVMRIRVSRGWKITHWFGHFYFRHNDLMVVPNCHRDQTFTIVVDLEENAAPDPYLYVQSALLYTNSSGERRIRLHTTCVPVTQHLSEVVSGIDEEATMMLLTHKTLHQAEKTGIPDARKFLQTECSYLYAALYQAQAGQPATMIPHYTLGILKSTAFRDMRGVFPDKRYASWARLSTLPIEDMVGLFLPRLYALHDIPEHAGTIDPTTQLAILPPLLAPSSCHVSQSGAYLVEDGESMLLWIGKAIDPLWIQAVLGVDSVEHLHPDHVNSDMIGASGTALGIRIATIINEIRNSRLPFMSLSIVRHGSSQEVKFFCMLIEDRSQAMMCSYPEFIQKLGVRTSAATTELITPSTNTFRSVGAQNSIGHQAPPLVSAGAENHHHNQIMNSTAHTANVPLSTIPPLSYQAPPLKVASQQLGMVGGYQPSASPSRQGTGQFSTQHTRYSNAVRGPQYYQHPAYPQQQPPQLQQPMR